MELKGYHTQPFYLRSWLKDIDKMLTCIKPPHEFRRTPRSIETSQNFWKASEYRTWILFYAIPILKDFLQPEYIHHLSLLVFTLHCLLSSYIPLNTLDDVQESLCTFYNLVPELLLHRVQQICIL